jgi:hypothetical protein
LKRKAKESESGTGTKPAKDVDTPVDDTAQAGLVGKKASSEILDQENKLEKESEKWFSWMKLQVLWRTLRSLKPNKEKLRMVRI